MRTTKWRSVSRTRIAKAVSKPNTNTPKKRARSLKVSDMAGVEVERSYLWALETLAEAGPGDDVARGDYKEARKIVKNHERVTDS